MEKISSASQHPIVDYHAKGSLNINESTFIRNDSKGAVIFGSYSDFELMLSLSKIIVKNNN